MSVTIAKGAFCKLRLQRESALRHDLLPFFDAGNDLD
jgi:hypothetical protein